MGVCEESVALLNEFLPSNFPSSCRLRSVQMCHCQSCSHAGLQGCAGRRTVVTAMWGESLSDCLFALLLWMIDSGLKMMAWQNHLLPQLTSTHAVSSSISHVSDIRTDRRHLYGSDLDSMLTMMIMIIKLMIKDRWDWLRLSSPSLTVTPWPFGFTIPTIQSATPFRWSHSN